MYLYMVVFVLFLGSNGTISVKKTNSIWHTAVKEPHVLCFPETVQR